MDAVYLDHNATTPLLPEAAEAMRACFAEHGNPSSAHRFGRKARQRLEDARESIAELLGALLGDRGGTRGDRVVFTSGGTEANNLALLGLASARAASLHRHDCVPRVMVSAIEHPSVARPAAELARRGWRCERIPVDSQGRVRVEAFAQAMASGDSTLVAAVMLGNHETGVLQPVAELAAIAAQQGVPMHTDAVQVVGKLPVDFRQLGVATLSAAAHKFHGPSGVGALLVREGVALEPLMFGGFQQHELRPGTESVALAVGMEVALRAWQREAQQRRERMTALRDRLQSTLAAGWPGLVVLGGQAERLPHTLCAAFPGLDRQALVMALDLAGVACSSGSACASGSSEPSPTLLAMGVEPSISGGALRFSLGALTSAAELDRAADCILLTCKNLAEANSRRKIALGDSP